MRKSLIALALVTALAPVSASAGTMDDIVQMTIRKAAVRERCHVVNDAIECITEKPDWDENVDPDEVALAVATTAYAIIKGRNPTALFLGLASDLCDQTNCTGMNNTPGGTFALDAEDDPKCGDWVYNRDLNHRPVVPTIRTGGSGIMKMGEDHFNNSYYHRVLGTSREDMFATTPKGALTRGTHLINMRTGTTDQRKWYGPWSEECGTTNGCVWRITRGNWGDDYTYAQAVQTVRAERYPGIGQTEGAFEDCPKDATGSGDAHHYYHVNGGFNFQCVSYVPNAGISPSGYAIPPTTVLESSNGFENYLRDQAPDWFKACSGQRGFVAKIIDFISEEGGGPTITEDDVTTPEGYPPTIEDLSEPIPDTPGQTPPDTGTPVPPDGTPPDPEPTPGTADPDNDGNPDWSFPSLGLPDLTLPTLDFPTWFDMPTFDFGAPECPIYYAEAFGEPLSLEIHCVLIAENQAVITALMVVSFTIGGALIVLKA